MSLRDNISLVVFAFRYGSGAAMAIAGAMSPAWWIGIPPAVAWVLFCGPVLRHFVLPLIFRRTVCPGCRRTLPLVGRFKCGDHYVDHRERHILGFCCPHGHRLESFPCPRCRSTILVQGGDPKQVRPGTAIRLKATSKIPDARGTALQLGVDAHRKPVGLPESRLAWHVAITGGTGRGKSTLLANLIKQLLARGEGFTVLDPGGDLATKVLQQVPPQREAQVLYIKVADRQHPCPLNLLSAVDDVERGVLAEELLGVFHRLHGAAWGPLLAHQLRMAVRAVMEAGGTLRDVYAMFVDAATRTRILAKVNDAALRGFWEEEFPAIPAIRRSAVTNKLAPIVFHPLLGRILCADQCVLNADMVIENRRIVIANLATGTPGDDITTLLGSFLVHKMMAAAYRQAALPAQFRTRHVLIADEFQRFVHRAAGFDQLLAEARKYKLSLVVANQFVEQLSPAVRAALFGNVGCLAAFRVGHRDARVLTPEFSGAMAEDLLELELGECLVRIGTDWTLVRTPPPPTCPDNDPSGRIIAANRAWFGQAVAAPQAVQEDPAVEPDADDEGELVE